MKKWLRELLAEQEGGGSPSMARFVTFACLIIAALIAFIGLAKGLDLSGTAILCSTFLGAGVGGKVIQKFAEKEPAQVDAPQEETERDSK